MSYGTESCVMSFIVNRPTNEPGFYLERQLKVVVFYTIKSYSVQANPEGGRYFFCGKRKKLEEIIEKY
jgi:ribulose-bisphosphate carboxylase small chain